MDDITKEQRICAIYVALEQGNHQCALNILNTTIQEVIDETFEQIITLVQLQGEHALAEEIQHMVEHQKKL
jgi:hypothetical protein